ncbi:MAG: hypothetical protein NWS28_10695 [Limnohabitans sp.]|nr:hypothetical protein [Limnohabitans sp.]
MVGLFRVSAFFEKGKGDAGAIGRDVFQFVLAQAQELPFAGAVLVARDLAIEGCPPWFFLAVLQFANHQAFCIVLAGAFLPMGGDFEGDGTGHPGADAAGEFGMPAVSAEALQPLASLSLPCMG